MNEKKQIGDRAERLALRYLKRQGVRIQERNVYNRGGEIDLIGRDQGTLVFFEVRYRGETSLGNAAESIDPGKQRRLLRAVEFYLHRNQLWQADVRIDVIAIEPDGHNQFRIDWIRNAIQGST